MPSVAINVVRYNHDFEMLANCLRAALNQTFRDCVVTLSENGSESSIEGRARTEFGSHPRFRYVDNGSNLGFSGAHNRFIRNANAEFVMPLNPDAILDPTYVATLLQAFAAPGIAAAEGKMLKPERCADGSWVLDGTGMTISRARRAHERGQLEKDHKQYDQHTQIFGVSATAAIYRKAALEKVRFGDGEYFDEDFFTYWEDLDLSWRLRLAGFTCLYVPDALVYHSRAAGQSKKGFRRPVQLMRHTRSLPDRIVAWDWRNHLLAIIKNDFGRSLLEDLPFIVARELALFAYLLVAKPRIIREVPKFFSLLPRILRKRRAVQQSRAVNWRQARNWFDRM